LDPSRRDQRFRSASMTTAICAGYQVESGLCCSTARTM
jgi:hypothetical protein